MAYNILKDDVEFSGVNLGTIEDMVDDHRDQSIAGVKTFTDMVTASVGISASVFYGDGSGLSGVGGAIQNYNDSGDNRLITSVDSDTVQGEANLTFDGSSLSVTGDVTASVNVSASAFQGDGNSLTNIGPSSLNLGAGLRDLAGNLELNLDTASGLQVAVGGLKIHPAGLSSAAALGDTDLFVVDQSGNKKATALQLYNYVDGKLAIPTVAGANTQVQFNDAGDLGASANLTFNSATNTLTTVNITASTHVSASVFYGDGSNLTGISGGSSTSFNSFTANFTVSSSYDIIGMNTSGSVVTGSLLAANAYSAGQRLVFKDIEGSGSTNNLVIEPSGSETIDGASAAKIKVNYGSITIISDGSGAFYIVGNN